MHVSLVGKFDIHEWQMNPNRVHLRIKAIKIGDQSEYNYNY